LGDEAAAGVDHDRTDGDAAGLEGLPGQLEGNLPGLLQRCPAAAASGGLIIRTVLRVRSRSCSTDEPPNLERSRNRIRFSLGRPLVLQYPARADT
jgi:hypothetical protein